MKTRLIKGLVAAAAFIATPALAQAGDASPGNGDASSGSSAANPGDSAGGGHETVSRSLSTVPLAPRGFGLLAGGGVTGFTRQGARDLFGTGGYWDVRAVLGTGSFLGAELAYVGSARDISASGVSGSAALLGNGAEAAVRGNLPLSAGALRIEPFVFGGVGWTYYKVVNSDANTSAIKDGANALTIPFGAGVSLAYAHFIVDARFTYRAVLDDKLVPTGNDDNLDLQNWSGGLTLGYEL